MPYLGGKIIKIIWKGKLFCPEGVNLCNGPFRTEDAIYSALKDAETEFISEDCHYAGQVIRRHAL